MDSKNVLAVVVGYNGGEKIINTISRLRMVVESVLVVDNGSTDGSIERISALNKPDVKLINLGGNTGIGVALNIGVRYAEANGFKWLLTMDQDTLVNLDLLKEFKSYLTLNPNARSLVPCVVYGPPVKIKRHEYEVDYAITSGHFLNLEIFKIVGYYNEELFIDGVDFDFCLRLRMANQKTICIPSAIINHELGMPHSNKSWLGKFYSIHSPTRRYYIYRNYFFLLRKYSFKFPKFFIKSTISHVLMLVAIIKYEDNLSENLNYIYKGIRHGFAGKYGKLDNGKYS